MYPPMQQQPFGPTAGQTGYQQPIQYQQPPLGPAGDLTFGGYGAGASGYSGYASPTMGGNAPTGFRAVQEPVSLYPPPRATRTYQIAPPAVTTTEYGRAQQYGTSTRYGSPLPQLQQQQQMSQQGFIVEEVEKRPSAMKGRWNQVSGSTQAGLGRMVKNERLVERGTVKRTSGKAQIFAAKHPGAASVVERPSGMVASPAGTAGTATGGGGYSGYSGAGTSGLAGTSMGGAGGGGGPLSVGQMQEQQLPVLERVVYYESPLQKSGLGERHLSYIGPQQQGQQGQQQFQQPILQQQPYQRTQLQQTLGGQQQDWGQGHRRRCG